MKLNNSLLGVLIVGIMCAGTFDCSAQNVRKKDDKGVPTFQYDSRKDRTKVTYPGGRTIIIMGKWDSDDARELEDTLQELEERLSELENIEIEIPDDYALILFLEKLSKLGWRAKVVSINKKAAKE